MTKYFGIKLKTTIGNYQGSNLSWITRTLDKYHEKFRVSWIEFNLSSWVFPNLKHLELNDLKSYAKKNSSQILQSQKRSQPFIFANRNPLIKLNIQKRKEYVEVCLILLKSKTRPLFPTLNDGTWSVLRLVNPISLNRGKTPLTIFLDVFLCKWPLSSKTFLLIITEATLGPEGNEISLEYFLICMPMKHEAWQETTFWYYGNIGKFDQISTSGRIYPLLEKG